LGQAMGAARAEEMTMARERGSFDVAGIIVIQPLSLVPKLMMVGHLAERFGILAFQGS
jgi:hypothetical protein